MDKKHFLIVGAGLSGLSVAYHLLEHGQQVTIQDQGNNKSSRIAAGMINALVFRRMTKSWRVDELLPFAQTFYSELEKKTAASFYHPVIIRRFYSSEQERQFWLDRQLRDDYSSYMELGEGVNKMVEFPLIKDEFGSGRVKQAAWINTPIFLDAFSGFLQKNCAFHHEVFDYSAFEPKTSTYHGIEYDHVVFCEGYEAYKNPWFSYLPVESTKGEILTIESENLPNTESLNRKCFVLPVGENTFKVGATYGWHTRDLSPTAEGQKELLDNFGYLSAEVPKIVDHLVGIRPTSPDRRPIVGRHPEFSKLSIFNGLGAKGYMIAPLLSAEFVDYLLTDKPLDREIRLERFKIKNELKG